MLNSLMIALASAIRPIATTPRSIFLPEMAFCASLACVAFALALADRVYVLEKGTIRFSGSAAELRDDKALHDQLLSL